MNLAIWNQIYEISHDIAPPLKSIYPSTKQKKDENFGATFQGQMSMFPLENKRPDVEAWAHSEIDLSLIHAHLHGHADAWTLGSQLERQLRLPGQNRNCPLLEDGGTGGFGEEGEGGYVVRVVM